MRARVHAPVVLQDGVARGQPLVVCVGVVRVSLAFTTSS